ncbi:MAG: DUF1634 domain-containing protein [Bryobacteraceae bacterium]|jgi:uncharacterized membrane protein
MERTVGTLLRAGVMLAAAVAAIGGVWHLAAQGFVQPHYGQFHPGVRGVRAFGWLTPPEAMELAGVMLLIATPVARVIFSLAAFALKRDWTYVAITSAVLAILLYSLGTAWL